MTKEVHLKQLQWLFKVQWDISKYITDCQTCLSKDNWFISVKQKKTDNNKTH